MGLRTGTLGWPRTGPKREMKEALEKYWGKKINEDELLATYKSVLEQGVKDQMEAGIRVIGVGDHTLYDHVLDWAERFGLTSKRVKEAGLTGLDAYFTQARGRDGIPALDMTKYFDSNYHNMVPEVPADAKVQLTSEVERFTSMLSWASAVVEGSSSSVAAVVLGPVTLAKLCKVEAPLTFDGLLSSLVGCYVSLLGEVKKACGGKVCEVQFHEPWLVKTDAKTASTRAAYEKAYAAIAEAAAAHGFTVNVAVHFDSVDAEVYEYLVKLPVQRITLDFCRGTGMLETVEKAGFPQDKQLGAGVVDGRNIWKNKQDALAMVQRLLAVVGAERVVVSPSCSLQYVPYDVRFETNMPDALKEKVAFAVQKLAVVVDVAKEAKATKETAGAVKIEDNVSAAPMSEEVKKMLSRGEDFSTRRAKQIKVPAFPTTTIGSFPQTAELRKIRLAFKQKKVSEEEYNKVIDEEIERVIKAQADIGLDVFVHGEPERSDMVEHFGVKLEGMAFTQHGWVQSYGSRYVRPPIIYDTIKRKEAMTVREFKVAQKAAGDVPVKGMLTGPVTILNWSFCRTDVSRASQALEVAAAIREEVKDLEDAGCRVIQVDEAALRERMPLKTEDAPKYMDWAVKAFRYSTAVAKPSTQIVTHMCYSSFEDIVKFIDEMDADVLTIENSRSGNEMLSVLADYGYSKDVGPGVYDIHSPVIPTQEQLVQQVDRLKASGLDLARIWVNPDCGLKTRKWDEVVPSLTNMVAAAKAMREMITPA
ncbi:5-methyltetrahydropteroyltriglutamate--homocysteine methyltransferase [Diplonema papillatum]|nr:5-methyltetrahydropteroyltriglutamate--homocysteine methyltransferase [Diplonema papillatum]